VEISARALCSVPSWLPTLRGQRIHPAETNASGLLTRGMTLCSLGASIRLQGASWAGPAPCSPAGEILFLARP
jgi:hypothetical protein